jgi:hypothetical protein
VKRDTITIVLVSESREPFTIEFSFKELVLIVVFLLTLIGAAVFSMVNFRKLKAQHAELNYSVQMLKENLSKQESHINELKAQMEAQKELILLIGANSDTSEVTPGEYSKDIQIENLETDTIGDSLHLRFQLVNNSLEQRLYSGYLLIVVEHSSGDLSKFGTFPEFNMAPGRPLNYRLGDTYAIRKFKMIEAGIGLLDSPANYNKIKFLVFDSQGKVLLYDNRIFSL